MMRSTSCCDGNSSSCFAPSVSAMRRSSPAGSAWRSERRSRPSSSAASAGSGVATAARRSLPPSLGVVSLISNLASASQGSPTRKAGEAAGAVEPGDHAVAQLGEGPVVHDHDVGSAPLLVGRRLVGLPTRELLAVPAAQLHPPPSAFGGGGLHVEEKIAGGGERARLEQERDVEDDRRHLVRGEQPLEPRGELGAD